MTQKYTSARCIPKKENKGQEMNSTLFMRRMMHRAGLRLSMIKGLVPYKQAHRDNCNNLRKDKSVIRCSVMTLAIFAAIPVAKAQNLVQNGGFESGVFSPWIATGNVVIITDAGQHSVGGINSFPNSHDAAEFGSGNRADDGVLSQTILTQPGQTYRLSFNYGNFDAISNSTQSTAVRVTNTSDNSLLAQLSVIDSSATRDLSIVFSPYFLDFTAGSAGTQISFRDTSTETNFTDGLLTDVSVSINGPAATPEPENIFFLLSGSIAVVSVLKRRRKRNDLHDTPHEM